MSRPSRITWPHDFRRLWSSQGASMLADEIAELAIPLLAVLSLHASAAELGWIGVARWLPFLLLALPLGVMVDRMRRRPLLLSANVGRAAAMLAIGALALAGILGLPALLVLAAVAGCFLVLYEVTAQAFVPAVVPGALLEPANARLQATGATMQIGGPGIGGALVQVVTAPVAVFVTGALYAVAATRLLRMRVVEATTDAERFLPALARGLRFLRGDRYLLANVGFSALYNPFAQWITVLLPLYAVQSLGLNAAGIGAVYAIGAAGALLGSLLTSVTVRRFGAGPPLLWCAIVECVAFLAIPLVDGSGGPVVSMAALAAAFAFVGAGTAMSSVILVTLRQLRTPDALLGRVNASMRWITYGTVAIGAAAGGFVGKWLGVRAGIAVGAVLCLGTIVWVALSPLPRIRALSDLALAERAASPEPAASD